MTKQPDIEQRIDEAFDKSDGVVSDLKAELLTIVNEAVVAELTNIMSLDWGKPILIQKIINEGTELQGRIALRIAELTTKKDRAE